MITSSEGCAMVNVTEFEVPPLLTTPICAVPGVAISLPDTTARNWVALTRTVCSLFPFQSTDGEPLKPSPVTVSVSAELPAGASVGFIVVTTGPLVRAVPFPVPPLAAVQPEVMMSREIAKALTYEWTFMDSITS